MSVLNWSLGIASAVIWLGVVYWYFKAEIKAFWPGRFDRWFRDDRR